MFMVKNYYPHFTEKLNHLFKIPQLSWNVWNQVFSSFSAASLMRHIDHDLQLEGKEQFHAYAVLHVCSKLLIIQHVEGHNVYLEKA